jgi:hypothetical protein
VRYHGFIVQRLAAAIIATLPCGAASIVAAHEIPNDVRINAFVKPHERTLALLIRVPLAAMIEVEFPTREPGYLDLARADAALHSATKLYLIDNITFYENDAPLSAPRIVAARVSLPSDRSFTSYELALAHVQGSPLPDHLELYWNQQLLDVLLEYPIGSERSEFAIHPRVDRFGHNVSTALRFLPLGGAGRAFEFHGDPGIVRLDPRWSHAALRFVASGFWHILEGIDHLLFLACLVIPFRRMRPLVIIVTAFTVGHSISLAAAAFGFVPDALWFPPLIETLIAVTILYMALENIVYAAIPYFRDAHPDVARPRLAWSGNISRRWIIAFAFGIVHGFGFSFALSESLQFAGDHLLTALFAFNLGVEIGQIAVLLLLVPLLKLVFAYVLPERLGIIMLSALVAHTAWHWMLERGAELAKFPMPKLDAALLASAMRGLMVAFILALGVLAVNGVVRRWLAADEQDRRVGKRASSALTSPPTS